MVIRGSRMLHVNRGDSWSMSTGACAGRESSARGAFGRVCKTYCGLREGNSVEAQEQRGRCEGGARL